MVAVEAVAVAEALLCARAVGVEAETGATEVGAEVPQPPSPPAEGTTKTPNLTG